MSKKLGASYWKLWTATAISNLGDGVSMVAYPWLASAVTRSPILIAAAGFASRLPWLVFTLHAGVLTDRFDRRKLIVAMDFMRGLLTVFVGAVVYFNRDFHTENAVAIMPVNLAFRVERTMITLVSTTYHICTYFIHIK